MNNAAQPLYMIRFLLDTRRFFDFAKRRGLLKQSCDEGYAIHSLMSELWGEMAPKPFHISGRQPRHITVLGYSIHPKGTFIEHAKTFADPACYEIVDWHHFNDKPMPLKWMAGSPLGFEVRVCPIKRSCKSNQYSSEHAERDAYLAYLENMQNLNIENQPPMTCFQVYEHWLKKQLENENGVKIEKITVDSFQMIHLQR